MLQGMGGAVVNRIGWVCAMMLGGLMAVLACLPAFELEVDGMLRIDTSRLPNNVSVSMWDTAAGDTELTFWYSGETAAASWSLVLGDVSKWQLTDKMEYLLHNFNHQEIFADLIARLALQPVSEGVVTYKWKRNQVEVKRPFVVIDLGGRRVSVLVDVLGDFADEVFKAAVAERSLSVIEWLGQAPSDAVDAAEAK